MRAFLLAVGVMAGCSKEDVAIEVGGIEFDYGFLVTYPSEGLPLRVSRTFGVEEGRVVFGELPALSFTEEERRFVFVAIKAEQLPSSFTAARAHEIAAELEQPPSELTIEGNTITELRGRMALPSETQLFTRDVREAGELRPVRAAEFDVLERVTLSIPIEPEHCRIEGQTRLAPFGRDLAPRGAIEIRKALYLDPDRALVATDEEIYSLDRGGTVTSTLWSVRDDPDAEVGEEIGCRNAKLSDLAISPIANGGSRRMIAVGGAKCQRGRIWPLSFDGTRIVLEGPSFTRFETGPNAQNFEAAVFTPDGRAWVGGPSGAVLTRTSTGQAFVELEPLPHKPDEDDPIVELAVGVGDYGLIASTKRRIHHLGPNGWEVEELSRPGAAEAADLVFRSFSALEDGPEIWAAGNGGQLARKRGGRPWELISEITTLNYPPAFAPCGSAVSPGQPLEFINKIFSVVAFEEHLQLGYERCTALVVIRRSDLCISTVAPENEEVEFSEKSITTIDRLDRRFLLGRSDGGLYETTVP